MTRTHIITFALLFAVAGCGTKQHGENDAESSVAANREDANAAENVASDATPAAEPSRDSAAAKAVAASYAAAISKGDLDGAAQYWSDAKQAAQFSADLEDYPKVKATAGVPVGAAGAIPVAVPLTLDLTLRSGSPYQMRCTANLRPVNDGADSTAGQRQWRIRSVEC